MSTTETRQDYQRKGLAQAAGWGGRPALLVVDFSNGFTDPSLPLGADMDAEIEATQALLAAFRRQALPVVFTTVAYAPALDQAPIFLKKVPSLKRLLRGTREVEIDPRLAPTPAERILEKQYASAFFGTDLADSLRHQDVDTVVIVGATTSGCVRASAVDSLQYDFYTVVVRDAVADRAAGPHEANLFDIDAKYGDVISLADALAYLASLAPMPAAEGR